MTQDLKNALTHLRLHFSLLLMPVYFFAVSQSSSLSLNRALWVFIILHLMVYPASNAYNSYHDKDTDSIGGLKNPPPVNELLIKLVNSIDVVAVLLSFFLLPGEFSGLLLLYVIFSRLYSNRSTRLKRYPIPAFLTVFIFQGFITYMMIALGIRHQSTTLNPSFYAALAASFQIGAAYPLTQIFQHKSDLDDGVRSLSFKLGVRGTFWFTQVMFVFANLFYFLHFKEIGRLDQFWLVALFQLPVVAYFFWWFFRCWRDESAANYTNTMRMSVTSAVCMNLCFILLFLMNNNLWPL